MAKKSAKTIFKIRNIGFTCLIACWRLAPDTPAGRKNDGHKIRKKTLMEIRNMGFTCLGKCWRLVPGTPAGSSG